MTDRLIFEHLTTAFFIHSKIFRELSLTKIAYFPLLVIIFQATSLR